MREVKKEVQLKDVWDAIELLAKARFAISTIENKIKNERMYRKYEEALKKLKEADTLITPLRGDDYSGVISVTHVGI